MAKEKTGTDTVFQDSFSEEIWGLTYKDYKDATVDDSMRRVAAYIASAEETAELRAEWTEKFYDLLTNFKAVAGGRINANAGTDWGGTTLANCYVGPLPDSDLDSIEGIYKVLVDQANTLKSEGGWGMDFSWIRPRGAFIKGIGVESPGSVRFMELFDKSSEIVTAGSGKVSKKKEAKGRIRKGAMMGTLAVWHPDIVEFITAKQTPGRLTKFNVSVNCTDDFMEKVIAVEELKAKLVPLEGKDDLESVNRSWAIQTELSKADEWELRYPETTHERYKAEWKGDIKAWEAKGYPVNVYDTVSVSYLWNLIMESTYNRNEPGVLFLDRANHFLPLNYAERILSTNPCGEQTLAPGGVCCLGTLNLTQFVLPDGSGFDLDGIRKYTGYLVRFLDNVNAISATPLPEYHDAMRKKRRIGCGVMGWGSALIMMGVRFGSAKAAELREAVMSTFARSAYMASIDLAEEKGKFEFCDPVKHAQGVFVQSLGLPQEYLEKLARTGIRNSSLLSQQPNGNGSIYANIVSGGMEPVFMAEYIRTVIVAVTPEHLKDVTPNYHVGEFYETEFFKLAKEGDEDILRGVDSQGTTWKIDRNRGLTKEVLCEDYGVRYRKSIGDWDPQASYNVTTTELTVREHVEDLKGFARWTDSACSKTCNIPHDYPYEDFKNLYLDVYKTGIIKGFTTYRAGTMTSVLSAVKETEQTDSAEEEIILEEIKLPDSLPATLKTLKSEGRKWYLTVILNEAQTKPVALFVQTNANEKTITANDAVEHLEELARSKGIPEKYIEETLSKVAGDNNPTKIARMISLNLRHGVLIRNVVSALDKVDCFAGTFVFHVRKFLSTFIKDGEKVQGEKCQECGSDQVVYQEGCKICKNCGSSKCG
jgi:ribonucleoside-diphosphate reductase alpha chain